VLPIETPGWVTVLTPLDPWRLAQIQTRLGRNKKLSPASGTIYGYRQEVKGMNEMN
jgi:hypothetical protein